MRVCVEGKKKMRGVDETQWRPSERNRMGEEGKEGRCVYAVEREVDKIKKG